MASMAVLNNSKASCRHSFPSSPLLFYSSISLLSSSSAILSLVFTSPTRAHCFVPAILPLVVDNLPHVLCEDAEVLDALSPLPEPVSLISCPNLVEMKVASRNRYGRLQTDGQVKERSRKYSSVCRSRIFSWHGRDVRHWVKLAARTGLSGRSHFGSDTWSLRKAYTKLSLYDSVQCFFIDLLK